MARTTSDPTKPFTISVPLSIHKEIETRVKKAGTGNFSKTACDLLATALNMSAAGAPNDKQEAVAQILQGLACFSGKRDPAGLTGRLGAEILGDPNLAAFVPSYLSGAALRPEWFVTAFDDPTVHVLSVPYSIRTIQDRLENLFYDWAGDKKSTRSKFQQISFDHESFDAVVNLEFAMGAKALYLFPFYLTDFRRSLFGALPYAKHVAIGISLRKDNPLVERLRTSGMDLDSGPCVPALVSAEGTGTRLRFLKEVFSFLLEKQQRDGSEPPESRSLVVRDNWLHREMLPLLKGNLRHGLPVQSFSERNFVKLATLENSWGMDILKTEKSSVLFYDLSNEGELRTATNSESHHFLRIRHGQDVPVGLGFTLNALPFLADRIGTAKKTVAAELLNSVLAAAESHKGSLAREFLQHGILLDPDFRYEEGKRMGNISEDALVRETLGSSTSQPTLKSDNKQKVKT